MNLAAIRQEVFNHGFDPVLFGAARVNQYINDGQSLIARRVDWYTDENAYDISTVAGTAIIPWPADFARGRSLRDTGRQVELQAVSLRDIDRSATQQGAPIYYAIDGPNIHLYPTPDGVYSLELRYWKLPPALVADTDVPALPADWHHLLWVYACWICYEAEDDPNMGQYWQGRFNTELAEFEADVKFPTTDYPTQAAGMWNQDESLSAGRGWSLWNY